MFHQRQKPGVCFRKVRFKLNVFAFPRKKRRGTDLNLNNIRPLSRKYFDITVDVLKMSVTGKYHRTPHLAAVLVHHRSNRPAVLQSDRRREKSPCLGNFSSGLQKFNTPCQIRKSFRGIRSGHGRLFGIEASLLFTFCAAQAVTQ